MGRAAAVVWCHGRTDRSVHSSAATWWESNLALTVAPHDRRNNPSIVRVAHELRLPCWAFCRVPFLNGLALGGKMLARRLAIRAARFDVHDDAHSGFGSRIATSHRTDSAGRRGVSYQPWSGHGNASVALIDDLELRISEIEHELKRSGADPPLPAAVADRPLGRLDHWVHDRGRDRRAADAPAGTPGARPTRAEHRLQRVGMTCLDPTARPPHHRRPDQGATHRALAAQLT